MCASRWGGWRQHKRWPIPESLILTKQEESFIVVDRSLPPSGRSIRTYLHRCCSPFLSFLFYSLLILLYLFISQTRQNQQHLNTTNASPGVLNLNCSFVFRHWRTGSKGWGPDSICSVYWQLFGGKNWITIVSPLTTILKTILKPIIISCYLFHFLVIEIDSGQRLKTSRTSLFPEFFWRRYIHLFIMISIEAHRAAIGRFSRKKSYSLSSAMKKNECIDIVLLLFLVTLWLITLYGLVLTTMHQYFHYINFFLMITLMYSYSLWILKKTLDFLCITVEKMSKRNELMRVPSPSIHLYI